MAVPDRRATRAVLVLIVALALVLLYWWRHHDRTDPVAASHAGAVVPPDPSRVVIAPPPTPPTTARALPDNAPPLDRLKKEYENYKKASIYPHWSIPLSADMEFALAWNRVVTSDLELGDGLVARFDGNTARVFGKSEPYVATISAWRVGTSGARRAVAVHVTRAAVTLTNGGATTEAFEVAFHDDGADGDATAGDLVATTRFVPGERPELAHASAARIEAYVEIDGTPARELVRDFVYAPRSVLEVRALHDRAKDGSLVATVDCDVHEKGVYTFYADLVAGDGTTPIAMTKLSFPLEPGARSVELTFFGKVIVDKGVDGPYTIRDVHGLERGEAGGVDVWWTYPPPYRTAAYAARDFSTAEWSDPERTERLANFERVIRELGGTP